MSETSRRRARLSRRGMVQLQNPATEANACPTISSASSPKQIGWTSAGGPRLSLSGQRTVSTDLARSRSPDLAVARADKSLASRFYHLKTGHCLTGQYLQWTTRRPGAKCWWCHYNAQTSSRTARSGRASRSLDPLGHRPGGEHEALGCGVTTQTHPWRR